MALRILQRLGLRPNREVWEQKFHIQSDGSYTCKNCNTLLPSKDLAERHDFDCLATASYTRKFGQWLSTRFIRDYGFDRRKTSTKMLEFLYFRHLADYASASLMATYIIVRALLMFKVDGVPFSGTLPYDDRDILGLLLSSYILIASFRNIREYKVKVIKEIPKLQKELGVTDEFLKKN